MSRVIPVNDGTTGELCGWMFECPGCDHGHMPTPSWAFNGDLERPTFSPSILVRGFDWPTDEERARIMAGEEVPRRPFVCHSFVRDGRIEFLGDCTHPLAGQTVDLPELSRPA